MAIQELAAAVGVSRQTLSRYKAEGCPMTTPEAVKEWRENNRLPRKGIVLDGGESLQERYVKSQIAKNEADAEAKRLKNAQVRGELYEAAEVERSVAELTSMIRCRLEAIPEELRTEWPADLQDSITRRMADKIHLILNAMGQWRLPVEVTGQASDAQKAASE